MNSDMREVLEKWDKLVKNEKLETFQDKQKVQMYMNVLTYMTNVVNNAITEANMAKFRAEAYKPMLVSKET